MCFEEWVGKNIQPPLQKLIFECFPEQYSSTTTDEYLLKKRRLSNKDFDILTNCKAEAGVSKVRGQSSWIVQDAKRMFQLHLQEYIMKTKYVLNNEIPDLGYLNSNYNNYKGQHNSTS